MNLNERFTNSLQSAFNNQNDAYGRNPKQNRY